MCVFTFGKHAGEPLDRVPTDYLNWCLRNIKNLRADLRAAIREELHRRGETDLKRAALRRAAFREAVAGIRGGLLLARPREHLLRQLAHLLLTGDRVRGRQVGDGCPCPLATAVVAKGATTAARACHWPK
jgi:hypothetical protein